MDVDFMVRYRAEYTMNAERMEHPRQLAQMWEPLLVYHQSEQYFPCDFYFDNDIYVDNNYDHYVGMEEWQKLGQLRTSIHVQEYAFADTDDIGEAPCIAIEYWHYSVYNQHPTWPNHNHDFELHTIVFLDQESESVFKIGYAHHWSIAYYGWNEAEWIGTHPKAYVAKGSHAADKDRDIPWEGWPGPGWEGDGEQLSWTTFKSVFVLHTDPCRDHSANYCEIVYNDCWHGYHFWWNNVDARDWWPREFPDLGAAAPWHRYTWDEPTTGNSAT